eukprot:6331600-Amphidinium_carterae.3
MGSKVKGACVGRSSHCKPDYISAEGSNAITSTLYSSGQVTQVQYSSQEAVIQRALERVQEMTQRMWDSLRWEDKSDDDRSKRVLEDRRNERDSASEKELEATKSVNHCSPGGSESTRRVEVTT